MGVTIYNEAHQEKNYKNLGVLLRYARCHKTTVRFIRAIQNLSGSGVLAVYWNNGSYAIADFASYRVMMQWLASRRSWRCADVVTHPFNSETFIGWLGVLCEATTKGGTEK